MSIIDKIKTKSAQVRGIAIGDPDFKTESRFLITLISEIERVGFDDGKRKTTDEEAINVINKFIKNASLTIEVLGNTGSEASYDRINRSKNEIYWLRNFLPVQLTEEEIKNIINSVISSANPEDKSIMGKVMNEFKTNYAGLYDPKSLSGLVKSVLG